MKITTNSKTLIITAIIMGALMGLTNTEETTGNTTVTCPKPTLVKCKPDFTDALLQCLPACSSFTVKEVALSDEESESESGSRSKGPRGGKGPKGADKRPKEEMKKWSEMTDDEKLALKNEILAKLSSSDKAWVKENASNLLVSRVCHMDNVPERKHKEGEGKGPKIKAQAAREQGNNRMRFLHGVNEKGAKEQMKGKKKRFIKKRKHIICNPTKDADKNDDKQNEFKAKI